MAPIALALLLFLAACTGAPAASPASSSAARPTAEERSAAPSSAAPTSTTAPEPAEGDPAASLREALDAEGIRAHLVALAEVAAANGGTRAAGTPGYDASADHVAQALEAAGWEVERQEFVFPYFDDPGTSTLEIEGSDGGRWVANRDFRALIYSAAGDLRAEVAVVEGGCAADDFDELPDGHIALTMGGGCLRRQQVEHAQRAGASAIVMATDRERDRVLRPTLLDPEGIEIPVLGVSRELSEALANAADEDATVSIRVEVRTEERQAVNVIGQAPGGGAGHALMLGAHLDSVIDGPGMNDNGSGAALVLALAEAIGERQHRAPIRVGFWAGEELGILGSTHYVESLTTAERDGVAIYLNFDMVGSPNHGRWVYADDRSEIGREATRRFLDWFDAAGLPAAPLDLGGGSDHGAFARAGIPTGGLFTGASERLSEADARRFGGEAGAPADPCYHLACDDLANVDDAALDEMADAAATVVAELAGVGAAR